MPRPSPVARTILSLALCATLVFPSMALAAAPPASSTRLESVDFASADLQKGYIAGGFAPDAGVVSRSTDGGATWHAALFPHWLHVLRTSDTGSSVMGSNYLSFDWVEYTANGGLNWATQHPAGSAEAAFAGLAHLSGDRRIAVGKRNDYAVIYSSVASGAWTKDYEGPIYPPDGDDPAPQTHAIFTAADAASGGDVAWVVGNDRTAGQYKALIRKTANGGDTWVEQTYATNSPWVTCVTAASTTHAYIGRESNYLLRTLNGGTTWEQKVVVNLPKANAIDSVDANNVVVVSDLGRVFRSTNAAASTPVWTMKTAGTNNLRGVKMLDSDSWIVVGDNETILRTDDAGATWIGSTALGKPTVAITSPANLFGIGSATIDVAGTSADPSNPVVAGRTGIGVAEVEVALQRANGDYWNGSTWGTGAYWHDATSSDGWDTWTASESIDSTASLGGGLVIWARSRDGMGQYSTSVAVASGSYVKPASQVALAKTAITSGYGAKATVSGTLKSNGLGLTSKTVQLKKGSTVVASTATGGGGAFSFYFLPANVATTYTVAYAGDPAYQASSANVKITPKASIARPVAPTARRYRYFTTYAYLLPKHSSGAGGTRFYFYRYQRLSNGRYDYVYKKSAAATTVNSTNYPTKSKVKVRVKLPAGKWRVRAKHLDPQHAETLSPFEYFRVK